MNIEQGVGLLISKKVSKSLLEWQPFGPRLLKERFNSKYTKLTVVTCYAPTEEAEDADKENFYEQLQAIMEEIPAHDMVLVIGDINARTGIDNLNRERTMGKEGLGTYYGLLNKRTRAVIFLGLFAQAVQAYSGRALIIFFNFGQTVRLFGTSNLHGVPSSTQLDR